MSLRSWIIILTSIGLISPHLRANAHPETLPDIVVEETYPKTSASQKFFPKLELDLRPNLYIDQLLELVPGLVVVQHAGGGKANQYYLRGFDADHGTDIAFYVDGIPANFVSHAHGQGYTDLNYVIPELVETIVVRKGPYYAEDGDFATAGAIELRLRETYEENQLTFQGGRFNTFRGLSVLGTQKERGGFYVATDIYTTDGPFINPEDFVRLNILAKGYFNWGKWKGTVTGSIYQGNWNASGQIPLPLVESGELNRFGSLDPTEGGNSRRYQFYADLNYRPDNKQSFDLLTYFYHYDLNLFSNFTFFLDDPINGDQIEQVDDRETMGLRARYRRVDHAGSVGLDTEVGAGLRFDHIDNQLNHTVARRLISRTTQNTINQFNPYVYGQEKAGITDWFSVVGGIRYDLIGYDVTDQLNQGIEGSKSGSIVSPKLSLVFSPKEDLDIYLNFGRGFHSNDARGVVSPVDPASIFGKAWGGELGLEAEFLDRIELSVTGYFLRLGSELVWVGDAGTTEPSGPTLRAGIETELRWQIFDWLYSYVDFTWTHAEFLDTPAAIDAVPLAPSWTLNGGIAANHPTGFYGSLQVEAISDRPANEDRTLTAKGFMVWNLSAGYRRGGYKIKDTPLAFAFQVDVLNLFNSSYRTAQFATTSRPFPNGQEITAIHFTPGWPLTILGSASLFF